MKCRIFGNYWRGGLELRGRSGFFTTAMTPFAGIIEVDDNGRFKGAISDKIGEADVQGEISGAALQFEKIYSIVNPGQTPGTGISYLLQGSATNGIHGGWWGIYTQDGEEQDSPRGQATCTIHPDPNE